MGEAMKGVKPHKDPSSYRKAARKEAKAMTRSGAARLAEAARKRVAAASAASKPVEPVS